MTKKQFKILITVIIKCTHLIIAYSGKNYPGSNLDSKSAIDNLLYKYTND